MTYVNEVEYKRAKDIDFGFAKKLKQSLDKKSTHYQMSLCHLSEGKPL